MTHPMERQMRDEERAAVQAITRHMTTLLTNRNTIQAADELAGRSGGWPYPPSRDLLRLFDRIVDTEWRRERRRYSNMEVEITVDVRRGRPPSVSVSATHRGEWRGGSTQIIRPGDTIASMSESIYGHAAYANEVLSANARALGRQCRQLPAGFGLEFPRLWVPDLSRAPRASLPSTATIRAVDIMLPTVSCPISQTLNSVARIPLGNMTIVVDLELEGNIAAQRRGTLTPNFNLRAYKAEVKRAIGPVEAGFSVGLTGGTGSSLTVTVANASIGDLDFSAQINAGSGTFEVSLGTKRFAGTVRGTSFEGSLTLKAILHIEPNPSGRRQPVRRTAPEPEWARARETSRVSAAQLVTVGALIVITAILAATPGGQGAALATGCAAMAVVAVGQVPRQQAI